MCEGKIIKEMNQSLDPDADPKSCDNHTNIRKKMAVSVVGLGDAVYAVNCGGEAHTDIFGIRKAIFIFFIMLFLNKCCGFGSVCSWTSGSGYVIICTDPDLDRIRIIVKPK